MYLKNYIHILIKKKLLLSDLCDLHAHSRSSHVLVFGKRCRICLTGDQTTTSPPSQKTTNVNTEKGNIKRVLELRFSLLGKDEETNDIQSTQTDDDEKEF